MSTNKRIGVVTLGNQRPDILKTIHAKPEAIEVDRWSWLLILRTNV